MAQSIEVKHNIEMAHRLECLPGKCQNIHGHSWWCHLEIVDLKPMAAPTEEGGIILNLHDVKRHFRHYLDTNFDHHLALDRDDPVLKGLDGIAKNNYYPGLIETPGPPSVENMAKWIGETMRKQFGLNYAYRVKLFEAATNAATWEG